MHKFTYVLVIVGALNWLLVGLFNWDIGSLFAGGQTNWIPRIIYILVGLSGLYEMFTHKSKCKDCEAPAPTAM